MKKILFLTASYGAGHLTANKSVRDALVSLYPGKIEMKTIDFLNIAGYLSTGGLFRKMYNWSMENPFVWNIVFNLTNSLVAQKYFNLILPLFYSSLYRIFDREKPDMFVLTHPYWNYIIGAYKNKYKKNIPCVMIVTDSTAIHHAWVGPGVDRYIVVDRDTYNVMNILGVDSQKIVELGFPVSTEFSKRFDRTKFLTGLKLNPELPTITIVIGMGSLNRFIKIIDLLRTRNDMPFQMILLTGKYERVYRELQSRQFLVQTKLVGWTDNMPDYIRAGDLVVAKGGGAIVMETLAAGKPVIIPVLTPGQEKGNAKIIKKYGLGFVDTSLRNVYAILCYLIVNPDKIKELQERVKHHSKPDACFRIAEFIHARLENLGFQAEVEGESAGFR
jgi:processive 1,2-diacylglycerol beta-glucosyltransferase